MDEKEKGLNEDQSFENNADNLNDSTLEEKDGVKYETNDNWDFEAEAPTLKDDMFDTPQQLDDNSETTGYYNAKADKPSAKTEMTSAAPQSDNQIVINKEPLKFIPLAIFLAAVIAVLIVLGVRYYTVPNGKEGDKMNPASVAATVDNSKVSIGMYNLYFSSVVSQYEQYANYGYYDLDTSTDYDKQFTKDEDGNQITWLEFFQQETLEQIKIYNAYYTAAKEAGITLTEAQQKTIDEQIEGFKTSASEEGTALNDYIADIFGEYCSEETVRLYMEQFYMSINYRGKYVTENTPTDEEISNYYDEHKTNYYKVNFSYLATSYDTSSDETKAESEKIIKDYMSKITDRQSIIDLIPVAYKEYIEQDAKSYMESDSSLSEEDAAKQATEKYQANVDGTIYGSESPFGDEINDWLFDENQPTGTVNYYVNEEMGYAYIILKTEQATRVEDETYSVRHILIMPETEREDAEKDDNGNTIYNDEEWAAAKEEAEKLLEEYNNGDKTEYSFALLAEQNSDDTASTSAGSSAAFGGLCEGVALNEMVPQFEGWATDDARKYGDTGIVESDYGYHIMFFINDVPSYQAQIISDIRNEQLDKIARDAKTDLHESAIKKANDKFLADKKAANASAAASANANTGASAAE